MMEILTMEMDEVQLELPNYEVIQLLTIMKNEMMEIKSMETVEAQLESLNTEEMGL